MSTEDSLLNAIEDLTHANRTDTSRAQNLLDDITDRTAKIMELTRLLQDLRAATAPSKKRIRQSSPLPQVSRTGVFFTFGSERPLERDVLKTIFAQFGAVRDIYLHQSGRTGVCEFSDTPSQEECLAHAAELKEKHHLVASAKIKRQKA